MMIDKKFTVFPRKDKFFNLVEPVFITKSYVRIVPRYYRCEGGGKAGKERLDKILKERDLFIDNMNGNCPVFESSPPKKTLCAFRFAQKHKNERGKVIVEVCYKVPPEFDEMFECPSGKNEKFDKLHAELLTQDIGNIKIMSDEMMTFKDVDNKNSSVFLEFNFEYLKEIDKFNRKVCQSSNNLTYTVDNICKRYIDGIEFHNIKNERILIADEIEILPFSNTTSDIMLIGRNKKAENKNMPVKISVDVESNTINFKTIEVSILDQIKNKCDIKEDCNKCSLKCLRIGTACSWSTVKNIDKRKNIFVRMVFDKEDFVDVMTKLIYFSEGALD